MTLILGASDLKLEIKVGNAQEAPSSNLLEIFKANCELTNAAVALSYDGSDPAPKFEDCENLTVPEGATEQALAHENEALTTLVNGLGSLDMKRLY